MKKTLREKVLKELDFSINSMVTIDSFRVLESLELYGMSMLLTLGLKDKYIKLECCLRRI